MKKISLFFICLFTILIASCSFNEIIETINETEFNITYHLNNDEKNYVDTTAKDEFYTFKTNFERENCVLEGWYYDEFLQTKCPGSIQINGDMDVYAKWMVNEEYYTNLLKSEAKNGVFTYYEMIYLDSTTYNLVQGTAFAFDEDENYYYCMTNNHVTEKNDSKKYIVLDNGVTYRNYYEESLFGSIFKKKYVIEDVYADEDYDLSIIKIGKADDLSISVLKFSETPIEYNDIVMSYGSPTGNARTLTAGLYIGEKRVELTDSKTNVKFDVLIHTSEIDNGSSGGPLFNENSEVVAVNFAGSSTKSDDEFVWGAAIPLNRVKEFIKESNYLNK